MTIEILTYRADPKGSIQGRFDVKRTMPNGRYVIYRNLVHWVKEGKAWVTPPNEKINENWEKVIEFDKDTSAEFYKSCMEGLKSYLRTHTTYVEKQNVFGF